MTREEAIKYLKGMKDECNDTIHKVRYVTQEEALEMAIKALEQEPSGDLISREELLKAIDTWDKFGVDDTNSLFRLDNLSLPHYIPYIHYDDVIKCIKGMSSVNQEPKTGQYEKHTDHTDCIWYGSDSGCPVTCSQYRDGWNDAMEYIFKGGKGYQLYRREAE